MQEPKQEKEQATMRHEMEERKSDATSKETMEDLEKSEKISDSISEREFDNSEMPSPDGTIDENRKQRDDAGPM